MEINTKRNHKEIKKITSREISKMFSNKKVINRVAEELTISILEFYLNWENQIENEKEKRNN